MRLKNFFLPSVEDIQEKLAQEAPLVLMSRGHSGTRVLSWVCTHLGANLGTSPDLATGDADDQSFTDQIKKIATHNIGITQTKDVQLDDLHRFQKACWRYFEGLSEPKTLWGWKFPETYLIAPYIEATFPKARYIHFLRDGRDIAFKKHLTDDEKRKLGHALLTKQNALSQPRFLQAAISWAFQVETFDTFQSNLAPERVLEIRFESLCSEPFPTAQKICEFLGVNMTESCKNYLQHEINTSKVGQYQEHSPDEIKAVEEAIGQTLRKHGYHTSQ